ncbi:hypothetical protein KBC79_00540 [Candidatus Woesebacteria bacterium]|nr:hypothetical protein [Candidatus Woesebacteria bacterium]
MTISSNEPFHSPSEKQRLVLFDGHAIIYRAYHAFTDLTSPDGMLVNAVYGFSRILLTVLRDIGPEYCVVTFDHKGPTQRSQVYDAYKAQRPPMPDDLKPQIDVIKSIVETLNIPQFSLEGYEADDLIGTITAQLADQPSVLSTVVTGDKDLFQLVTDQVNVWIPARASKFGGNKTDTEYDAEAVYKRIGVWPNQVVDLKALMGDPSDNIPGVKGVGPKTAVALITTFQTVDGVYQAVEDPEVVATHPKLLKPGLVEKLVRDKDQAYLSRELATINRQVPIKFQLDDCLVTSYDKERVTKRFEELEFRSLIHLLPKDEFELAVQQALF